MTLTAVFIILMSIIGVFLIISIIGFIFSRKKDSSKIENEENLEQLQEK